MLAPQARLPDPPRAPRSLFARTAPLLVGLAFLVGCTGLSCGAGASGCGSLYAYPQTAAQVPNGTEPVDEGVRLRMTQQGLDLIIQNIRPILGSLLGNDPSNPDNILISTEGGFDIGGGFSVGQGPSETHPTEIVINAAALAAGMQIEFVGDDVGEPTGIRLVATDVPVGLDARVFWDVDFGFTATAACDLFGTNSAFGGRPMVTTLSIEAIITPRVGSGAQCDDFAPECLKIDIDVQNAEIGDLGISDIDLDKPPSACESDGLGPCSEECSDTVPFFDEDGDNECSAACGLGDVLVTIAAGLFDLLGGIINDFLPGILEDQLRSALDEFDGSPIAASGRLDVAGFAPGVLPGSALDLGYMVGPTVGAFSVNDPANVAGAHGMDLIFRSGFEAAPALEPEDTPVPHPCVRPIAGNDFASLYGGFRFETPDVEPLTGVYDGQVYSLGMSVAEASINQALFGMYNTGAFCLETSTEAVHQLTSGAFTLSAGLIDVLTEGQLRQYASPDAPAIVALAPAQPPVITFGAGNEEEGHINLNWPGVEVSFYVLINERFSRVFAITADISMQLSVFNDPETRTLRIAVVDGPTIAVCADCTDNYNELIPGINFAEVLEQLVGTLFDAALGDGLEFDYDITSALADALGVPLYVNFLGLETTPTDDRAFLNVYLQLTDTLLNPARLRTFDLRLSENAGVLRERQDGPRTFVEPTGAARVEVETDGLDVEYFARVDFGAWRGPLRVTPDGTVVVKDPKLRAVGEHSLTLRGRHVGDPNSLEAAGNVVTVWVDPEAPVVRLAQRGGELVATATDVGTALEDLQWQWQVDDGAWSPLGSVSVRPLADVRGRFVAVRAIDRAGNISKPAGLALDVARLRAAEARADEEAPGSAAGCAQTGAAGTSLVAVGLIVAWMLRARARRRG